MAYIICVCSFLLLLIAYSIPSSPAQESAWQQYSKAAHDALRRANYGEAEQQLTSAVKAAESFGPADPRLALSLNDLAVVYFSQGKYPEAEPLYKRALAIREKTLGPNDPKVGLLLSNLAVLYFKEKKYAEAEPLHKRALAISEARKGPNHPDVAASLHDLAGLYCMEGKYAQAEPLFKRALAIRETAMGPDDPELDLTLINFAELYRRQGNYPDAESLYKRSLAIHERASGAYHLSLADVLEKYAGLLRQANRVAEAEKLEARARAVTKPLNADLVIVGAQEKKSAIASADAASFPIKKTIVPSRLSVTIYSHQVRACWQTLPAWSFVSSGLKSLGQDEVVITIIRRKGEAEADYPPDALKLINTVYHAALEHKLVTAGGRTQFSGESAFPAPQFKGIIYVPARHFDGVETPPGALSAVSLTAEELQVYETSGAARVLGRLSRQIACFPYPNWCDRDRKTVFSATDVEAIKKDLLVEQSARVFRFDMSVMAAGNECSLLVQKESAKKLAQVLSTAPATISVMLCVGIDPRANAFIVWNPLPQKELEAVGPEGSDASRLSGAFLEIVPGVQTQEFSGIGDGFALMLSNDSWKQFKEALQLGKDFSVAFGDGAVKTFSLKWAGSDP